MAFILLDTQSGLRRRLLGRYRRVGLMVHDPILPIFTRGASDFSTDAVALD